MNKYVKRALKILGIIAGSIVGIVLIFALVLTIGEYRPDDVEQVGLTAGGNKTLAKGESITILSWNIGYGGLSETADFFMDGGKGVRTQDEDQVKANVQAVVDTIKEVQPEIVFLQEIDRNSTRSWGIDQVKTVGDHTLSIRAASPTTSRCSTCPSPFRPTDISILAS